MGEEREENVVRESAVEYGAQTQTTTGEGLARQPQPRQERGDELVGDGMNTDEATAEAIFDDIMRKYAGAWKRLAEM